jgi:uncharacterized membrane protein YbaN (DUF454 family)
MHSIRSHAGHISAKALVFLAIAICLALGLIGLVLPIIPGLLFLAIAAVLLAPHVPALGGWMRRSPMMSRYMDDAERLGDLNLEDQLKLGFFLSLRMLIDGIRFGVAFLRRRFDDLGAGLGRCESSRN